MVEIVNLALRAVIDSFEINTINFLIKKKLRLILICPKINWGSTTKKEKMKNIIIIIIIIIIELLKFTPWILWLNKISRLILLCPKLHSE